MLVEYFVEYALRTDPKTAKSYYEPIGVWAHGVGSRLQVTALYLPGNEARQERADATINYLIEQDVRVLPEGWLRDYASRIPIMQGDGSQVYTTERYGSSDEVAEAVVQKMAKGKLSDPPLVA